jgi:CDP-glycerol glycerophosphotransferase
VGAWTIEVTVSSGGLVRTGLLDRRDADVSIRVPWCLDAGEGRVAAVVADKEQPLRITVHDPAALVVSAERGDAGNSLVLVTSGPRGREVQLLGRTGGALVPVSVAEQQDGTFVLRFELPAAAPRRFRAVVLTDGDEEPAVLAPWTGGDDSAQDLLGTAQTPPGAVLVRTDAVPAVARAVSLAEDGLEVAVDLGGLEPAGLRPRLRSNVASVLGTVRSTEDGPVLAVPWLRQAYDEVERPLPAGRYVVELVDEQGATVSAVRVPRELATGYPHDVLLDDQLRVTARVVVPDDRLALAVVVRPPLRPDERGARNGARLRARANAGSGSEPAVFLRTLSGEATNDSALEIQHELERRNSGLAFWWSIRDRSVPVPPGAVGLVEQSEAWHRALGDACCVVVNIHQPEWYRRPPAQRMVQTFHGYPYKRMGLTHWRAMDLPAATIASYHDRARDWTHLVSPSAYATPLLTAEFLDPWSTSTVEIVEAGYPRNDALFAADRDQRAQRVRRALGVPDDAFLVLYAPTFRDALSLDGRTAERSDFFDPEELITRLGPRTWVLMRGHAFHARNRDRGIEGRQVLDVTHHPDVTDLILASDAGILDYSSLRFDYALTRKPMVFLVPDEKEYHALRPGLLPYDATSPGPHVRDTAGVAEALRDPEALRRRYAQDVEAFVATYMELEDGHAAARVVDAVFRSD